MDTLRTILFASTLCLTSCTALTVDLEEEPGSDGNMDGIALALINGSQDSVAILNYENGCLADTGQRLSQYVDNPRFISVRKDSKEALIAYGAVDKTTGVLVVSIDLDKGSAEIAQNIVFEDQSLPNGITYSGNNAAMIASTRSDLDQLVALTRNSEGRFEISSISTVRDDFVVGAGRAGETPLILRGNTGSGEPIEFSGLRLEDEGYVMQNTPLQFPGALNMGSHPTLPIAYVPAKDPSVEYGDLEPTGNLHVNRANGDGAIEQVTTYQTPGWGSMIDVSPNGDFLVTDVAKPFLSESGYPVVQEYVLQMVKLDSSGMPVSAELTEEIINMLLFHDIKVAPDGNIILSKKLYDDQADEGLRNPVSVLSQTNGKWQTSCEDLHLGGQVRLGLATPKNLQDQ